MIGQPGAACAGADVDLTEVREYDMGPDQPASTREELDEARAMCMRCPLLVPCRRYALTHDVAGMAGGLTEVERETWRWRSRVRVEPVSIVDVTPGRLITPRITDALPPPDPDGVIPQRVVDLVMRMTREGISAEEIVARLDRPDVTHRTVKYLRHRYQRGPTRVDA